MRRQSRATGPSSVESRCGHVCRQLSEARLNQGITMAALARALGCSISQLERMETGQVALSAADLLEWVLALNLDLVVQPRRGWPGGDAIGQDSADARLLEAYRMADTRTRDAVAVMLGLDRPAAPPIRLTRTGRPPAASRPASLHLTLGQVDQLRQSPIPFTGNRVITALKLADGTMTQLAHQARLRYSRVIRIVNGKARAVPASYAAEIASCFGCVVHDLFPPATLIPSATEGNIGPATETRASV